jgi:hypothetical protein
MIKGTAGAAETGSEYKQDVIMHSTNWCKGRKGCNKERIGSRKRENTSDSKLAESLPACLAIYVWIAYCYLLLSLHLELIFP